MSTSKLVILVLVVLGVLAFMALGADAYQIHQDGKHRSEDYRPRGGVKGLGHATGWMLARFDRTWMSGCGAPATTLNVPAASCEVTITAKSRWPSRFTLRGGKTVTVCFALSHTSLVACPGTKDEQVLDEADFTVARDTAFLWLRCRLSQSCSVAVVTD